MTVTEGKITSSWQTVSAYLDGAFSGKGEILIAAIHGAELVAFLRESQSGETRSIIIESARPRVSAPSRPGGKAITSPREMLPPPSAPLRKRRVPKVDDTAPVAMEQIGQALKASVWMG